MEKHLKEKIAVGVAFAFLAGGPLAWGFPTWMGVYGAYQTHDGVNPGTCT